MPQTMIGAAILLGLADVVLVLHFGIVIFVVGGLVLIGAGWWSEWTWVRNAPFRLTHVLLILFVAAEDWLQVPCPLTDLEQWLRRLAGAPTHDMSFIAHWLGQLQHAFVGTPPAIFVAISTVIGLLTLLMLFVCPPQLSNGVKAAPTRSVPDGDPDWGQKK